MCFIIQVLKAQSAAKAKGYSDVIYLDCVHKKYLEEVSSANIFIVKVGQQILHFFSSFLSVKMFDCLFEMHKGDTYLMLIWSSIDCLFTLLSVSVELCRAILRPVLIRSLDCNHS